MNSTKYVGENESLGTLWSIREIDAWTDPDGGWTWNDAFTIKRFRSDSVNLKRLFLRVLADVRGHPLEREGCSAWTTPTGTSSKSGEGKTTARYGRWCGRVRCKENGMGMYYDDAKEITGFTEDLLKTGIRRIFEVGLMVYSYSQGGRERVDARNACLSELFLHALESGFPSLGEFKSNGALQRYVELLKKEACGGQG